MKVTRLPVVGILALVCMVGTDALSPVRADSDVGQSYVHEQDSVLKDRASDLRSEISDLRTKIFFADLGIVAAKSAIDDELNKPKPDGGTLFVLRAALLVAQGIKDDLERDKAAKERELRDLGR